MAQHVRTQIRVAVAALLSELPTVANRVYVSRVYPLERASLPGLIIMTASDENDTSQGAIKLGSTIIWSKLQLIVKAFVKGTADVDTSLDQIENEVRKVLMVDRTLGGLAKNIRWLDTTIQLDSGSEQPIGLAEILFCIDYRINENMPDVALG